MSLLQDEEVCSRVVEENAVKVNNLNIKKL